MTICIAALGDDGNCIFGASDRLLTSYDDVGHEPDLCKFKEIKPGIVMMKSGLEPTIARLTELFERKISAIDAETPNKQWTVEELVNAYLDCFNEMVLDHIQRQYLSIRQLNHKSFLSTRMTERMADYLNRQIEDAPKLPIFHVSVIFAGYDNFGGHICEIERNIPLWQTSQGYAVIGSGAKHAESQLLNAKHSPNDFNAKVGLNVVFAKKRAEVVRTVGKETDLFWIFNVSKMAERTMTKGEPGFIQNLVEKYEKMKKAEKDVFDTTVEEFKKELTGPEDEKREKG